MSYANGRLPASALARIPGNGYLELHAAAAYNAMARRASQLGTSLAIYEGSIRRTYRPLSAQQAARRMWCAQGRCGNAAVPGTSNHGWGLAIDLASLSQRRMVDRCGRGFGFAKSWSDAPWEWWHIRYRAGVWSGHVPKPAPRVLRRGQRGPSITKVQRLLRAKNVKGAPKVTGYFGIATERAVKRFQKKHHLKADGLVGPRTLALLRR